MAQLNQRSLDRLKGVKKVLIDILIEASKDSPYEFQIPADGGLRTAQRQNELFKSGVSKCDGFTNLSEHQKGTSFDIFLLIEGRASWDKPALKKTMYHIKDVAKFDFNIDLDLGCDWKGFVDFPHAQIKK